MDCAPDATAFTPREESPRAGGGAPASAPASVGLQSYDMTGKKYMLIFNHFKYQDSNNFSEEMRPRHGTSFDVAALSRAFSALGFSVRAHDDQTHDDIMDIMTEFSSREHSSTACVCVAVLTHGGLGGRVAAADRCYELRDLVAPLQRCAALAGKPKLFVVQACRGLRRDPGVEYDGAFAAKIGTHADTLVFYSTVEDFVSWRGNDGSWMIQELCAVLRRAHCLDLLHITTLVTSIITQEYVSCCLSKEDDNKKQTPETCSTLTKLLYFTPAAPAAPAAPRTPPAAATDAGCHLL